jgi:hypothetical protein
MTIVRSPFGKLAEAKRRLNAPAESAAPAPAAGNGNPYAVGTLEHRTYEAVYARTFADIEAARQRGEVYRDVKSFVTGRPQPQPQPHPQSAAELAAAIVNAGAKARGELVDPTPRDRDGVALDPSSIAAQIIKMGRRARGEKED